MTYKDAMEYREHRRRIDEKKKYLSLLDSMYYLVESEGAQERAHYNEEYSAVNREIIHLTSQCEAFERWIATVPDRIIQTYMYMRFVDGLSWAKIGAKMKCKGPTARKAVTRYLEKEARRNDP